MSSSTIPTGDRALQELWGTPPDFPTDFVPDTPLATPTFGDDAVPSSAAALSAAEGEALHPTDPREVLRRHWGYPDFRGIQRDIIDSILARQDTVGLMPTGGGKSVTFQVPALMMEGTCLVITPLIALMKDQVIHLRARGILATAIHSGLSREEMVRELDNVVLGGYKFLYLSPERLHSDTFRFKLQYMTVSFIAVDEAHCISQWGYDFRPAYLNLRTLRELLPDVPVLALTATATAQVLEDIQEQLAFREQRVFRMSFERTNLHYFVQESDDKLTALIALLHRYPGSAIVYTRSRSGTRDTALALTQAGISALYYHAGLPAADKDARQQAWQSDEVRVMVSTNAFGMGIDKPDVRLVVHLDLPDSIEAYFQEAGRAGRDGQTARAVLLFNGRDHRLLSQRIAQTFPEKEKIRQIYDDVGSYYQLAVGDGEGAVREFDLDRFCRNFHHFPLTVVNSFTILQRAGVLEYAGEEETRSRLMFICRREELYDYRRASDVEDVVLTALLRAYSGLFSEYVFIEEAQLAYVTALSEGEVYEALMHLSRLRLLDYVPRKSVAHLNFLMRRIDSARLPLPPEVYELRLERYAHRINAMLDYCTTTDRCRSRLLLEYFDDHAACDCGHCDVCADHPLSPSPADLEARLLDCLSDGKPHTAADFHLAGPDLPEARRLVRQWLDEGRIVLDDGRFMLRSSTN